MPSRITLSVILFVVSFVGDDAERTAALKGAEMCALDGRKPEFRVGLLLDAIPFSAEMELWLIGICPRRRTFLMFCHRSKRKRVQQHRIRVGTEVSERERNMSLEPQSTQRQWRLPKPTIMLSLTEVLGPLGK